MTVPAKHPWVLFGLICQPSPQTPVTYIPCAPILSPRVKRFCGDGSVCLQLRGHQSRLPSPLLSQRPGYAPIPQSRRIDLPPTTNNHQNHGHDIDITRVVTAAGTSTPRSAGQISTRFRPCRPPQCHARKSAFLVVLKHPTLKLRRNPDAYEG